MNTVLHPEVRLLHKSAKQIMDTYAEAAWQSAGDFAQVEEAVRLAILELRMVLTSAGLRLSAEKSRRAQHCPGCGLLLRAWSLEPRRVVTAEGEATYSPIRYRCTRCEEDYYPLEEANGLSGSQYTTGAKAVIAETAAQRPYGHVSRSLGGERGLSVSPKEVDRTVREVAGWRREEEATLCGSAYGPEAALLRAADADPLAGAPALHGFAAWPGTVPALISVDGAMVRSTRKGPEGLEWFECRAGVIRSVDDRARSAALRERLSESGNRTDDRAARLNDANREGATHREAAPAAFYTGGVCAPDALFDQLGASWRKAVPSASECVFVADGARWIWDRVQLYFPDAVQVLDFYHACEHIGSATSAWFGERTAEAIAWRQTARKMLLEPGGASVVIRELLEALRDPEKVADPDLLRAEIRYLFGHRHRMRYYRVKERGLPIGSGAMESGIKQMTTARLRMPGMKWTRDGADAILRIRAAHLSQSLRMTTQRRHGTLQQAAAERYRRPEAIAA